MDTNIVHSKVRCPKCGCFSLTLTEVWEGHTISWEQEDGTFDRNNGALEPGDAYKVEGKCKRCSHVWRLRNAKQIDDITI